MLGVDDAVVSVAAMHDSTTVCLVSILEIVIIIVESICGTILKEEASLSLSKTRDIFLIGIGKIKVEDAHVQVMQLEVWLVLVLGIASREIVLLEANVVGEFQRETIVSFNVLIQNLINSDIKILCSKLIELLLISDRRLSV